jgi:hypothetical protein
LEKLGVKIPVYGKIGKKWRWGSTAKNFHILEKLPSTEKAGPLVNIGKSGGECKLPNKGKARLP